MSLVHNARVSPPAARTAVINFSVPTILSLSFGVICLLSFSKGFSCAAQKVFENSETLLLVKSLICEWCSSDIRVEGVLLV